MNNMKKDDFNELVIKSNSICILGHERPDGDCIGSSLAIYNYIKNISKNKFVKIYLDECAESFNILPNCDKISQDTNDAIEFDLCIVVDCGQLDRFSTYKRYYEESSHKICFDHHENNSLDADYKYVDENIIATAEIIYDFFDEKYIDKNVAMCLYLGIATDSGVFRYKATTKKTFNVIASLVDYGFDFSKLLDTIIFDNKLIQRKAQGIAFDRLKLICKGQVSFSYFTNSDYEELNIDKKDIDNIIVYLREIEKIKIAAFAYQVGYNIYKLSIRSKFDEYNVAEFARMHEGGGHRLASGCIYKGDLQHIISSFEKDMTEFLDGK